MDSFGKIFLISMFLGCGTIIYCVSSITKLFSDETRKKTTGISIDGKYKTNEIIKYNYNSDPNKYKKEINKINNKDTKESNVFVFSFSNMSLDNIKSKSNPFQDLFDFINFVMINGNSEKDTVIIRINSPGGYAFQFEEAYTKLNKLKKKGFSVIAIVDSICASGGYMLACACNKIIVAETSLIGSVGVI